MFASVWVIQRQILLASAQSLSTVSVLVLLHTKGGLTLGAVPILNTTENNKIMNGVLPGRVHRLCEGVLYFWDIIQFHALHINVNYVFWAISTHIEPRHSLLSECRDLCT
jgi:hypothetical protein